MKITKYFASIIFLCLIIASCSTPRYLPSNYNIKKNENINKNYTKVWDNLKLLLASWGITPNIMDVQNGYIQFKGSLGDDYYQWCDCGTNGKGFGYYGRVVNPDYTVTITLTKTNETETNITVNSNFYSLYNNYALNYKTNQYYLSSQDRINCNSIGEMESSLITAAKGN